MFKPPTMKNSLTVFALSAALLIAPIWSARAATTELLNVSYDPTRELYVDFNDAFTKYYKKKTGQDVKINQSHGGSGKQARSVIDGIEADVVTLALAADIDALHKNGQLVAADWQKRLPNNSSPYTSTIVFLVRKGNPKHIKDWDDTLRSDVGVITPSPKTSGGARWNYLAAWGYALKKNGNDEAKAKDFVAKLYQNILKQNLPLGAGARDATSNFVQRGLGDVLLAWENEAYLALKEFGNDKFEIVTPSISILAEPPVTVVDKVVDKRKTRAIAEDYLKYLYTPEGQEIAARNFYRPRLKEVADKYADKFAKVELFTIDDMFGGWAKTQPKHFDDGGIFDQIFQAK